MKLQKCNKARVLESANSFRGIGLAKIA